MVARLGCSPRLADILTADDGGGYLAWIFAGVTTVISVLSGVVATFYKRQIADYDKREIASNARITALENQYATSREEIKDCHKQREEIRVELTAVKTRLEILESRVS